jgi:hypothetical protein
MQCVHSARPLEICGALTRPHLCAENYCHDVTSCDVCQAIYSKGTTNMCGWCNTLQLCVDVSPPNGPVEQCSPIHLGACSSPSPVNPSTPGGGGGGFDAASFFGGIILAVGLIVIGYFGMKYYTRRKGAYQTVN